MKDASTAAGDEEGRGAHWGQTPQLRERIVRHREEYGDGHVVVGKAPTPGSINLGTNDYLALGRDVRLADAQVVALRANKPELFISGAFSQFTAEQREAEQSIAAFMKAEAAVLCQSGYAANDGLLQCIAGEDIPAYVDMFAHASLWQGALSGRAQTFPFRHNKPEHLRSLVNKYGPGVVAVDSIYSTIGSLCRLEEILEVCEETGCILVVDESHTVGCYGPAGAGLVVALGLSERVHYRTFSASKTLVSRAGVVLGPSRVLDYFRYNSWPAIFSAVMLPWEIDRVIAVFEIFKQMDPQRERLAQIAARMRGQLTDLGYDVSASQSQIIPLVAGPESNTRLLRDALEDRGIFGAVFCAPATPKNRSLVRLSLHSELSDDDLDRIIAVCREIRGQVRLDEWPANRRRAQNSARSAGRVASA